MELLQVRGLDKIPLLTLHQRKCVCQFDWINDKNSTFVGTHEQRHCKGQHNMKRRSHPVKKYSMPVIWNTGGSTVCFLSLILGSILYLRCCLFSSGLHASSFSWTVKAAPQASSSCYLVTPRSSGLVVHLFKQNQYWKENTPELFKHVGYENAHTLASGSCWSSTCLCRWCLQQPDFISFVCSPGHSH